MKNRLTILILFLSIISYGFSQDGSFKSIHQEESERYDKMGFNTSSQYDSLNGFKGIYSGTQKEKYTLDKRVFGYHPYWGGSNYLNYHWDLLSDLCYFSYEVDPATGEPVTVHEWETSPAIDSAIANGVRVHLCVTLFSGHSQFFGSPGSQQTLITNIIDLVSSRGANGVNMDVEALPSSLGGAFTAFMNDLSSQFHTAIPEGEVSIAAPAVNWSGTFDIPALNTDIDFFMVMCYDYYWNGSSQAGPVSPLYTMTGNYDYSLSKTISYYQSQGVPGSKVFAGIPYYARQWPTAGQYAPAGATGSGTAYTYANIRYNASGYYTTENKLFEANSFSPYYSFEVNGWHQCFMEDPYSLGKKYDVVNRRKLAGIGIWALGYDNGYDELWDLIGDKFSTEAEPVLSDTIFDSGGPAFNYYNNETYTYTITVPSDTTIGLFFNSFGTESGNDSLWIYDGPDINYPLAGSFSGNALPGLIQSSGNSFTLKFHSDAGITGLGWRAVYNPEPGAGTSDHQKPVENKIKIYPNPVHDQFTLECEIPSRCDVKIIAFDPGGKIDKMILHEIEPEEKLKATFTVPDFMRRKGTFLVAIYLDNKLFSTRKIIVN